MNSSGRLSRSWLSMQTTQSIDDLTVDCTGAGQTDAGMVRTQEEADDNADGNDDDRRVELDTCIMWIRSDAETAPGSARQNGAVPEPSRGREGDDSRGRRRRRSGSTSSSSSYVSARESDSAEPPKRGRRRKQVLLALVELQL